MGKLRDDRDEAIAYAQDCIREHGIDAGPKMARQRYPDVDRVTFWRWMKSIQADAISQAAAAVQRAMEITPAEYLPVPPSPAIIARNPSAQRANLDFMGKLDRLYTDGEMLRAFAIVTGPDGVEKIKMAHVFATSIKTRSDLLERWIQASQMLFDWEQMSGFYESITAIVKEIAESHPEVGQEIMTRLAELNQGKGFNVEAQ